MLVGCKAIAKVGGGVGLRRLFAVGAWICVEGRSQ